MRNVVTYPKIESPQPSQSLHYVVFLSFYRIRVVVGFVCRLRRRCECSGYSGTGCRLAQRLGDDTPLFRFPQNLAQPVH